MIDRIISNNRYTTELKIDLLQGILSDMGKERKRISREIKYIQDCIKEHIEKVAL